MADQRNVRGWPLAWATFFLVGICLPLAEQWMDFDRTPAGNENRNLAERPMAPLTLSDTVEFPRRFEAYHRDHFGLRNRLLKGHRWLHLQLLGVSPVDKVMVGRDGWFFLADEALQYQHSPPLKTIDLAAWGDLLEERRQWLEDRGIVFLFVLAPNKHTLYPEKLPSRARALSTPSRADQLLEFLSQQTEVNSLDLRATLRVGKARERVFYTLDTHWNDYGNYLAYHAVIERLGARLVGLKARPMEKYKRRERQTSGDLARQLGLEGVLFEKTNVLRSRRRPQAVASSMTPPGTGSRAFERSGGRYRVLVLGDSFGARLLRPLAEHFARLAYSPGYHLPLSLLEQERPDVVIMEIIERTLATSDLQYHLLRTARQDIGNSVDH